MKKVLIAILLMIPALSALAESNRAAEIVKQIHNPESKTVLVACHRGDWRNYPENSLKAMESVIKMGADIVELDLALTSDSVLVVCHDRTLDRTTTGKGLISDIPFDSIARVNLRSGHGVATKHKMPTLRQALELCKDRIVINIDKGYEYYDLILPLSDALGTTDQLLIKGKKPVESVEQKMAEHKQNMMYMPIIDIQKPKGKKLFDEYISTHTVPLAYEVCWRKMAPEVTECFNSILKQPAKLWVNTLWGSLCGGMDDDTALETSPDRIYGPLIDMGATIIQTDRPELLLNYLRSRKLHD